MKDWQHGYEIDFLKEVERRYARYNSFTYSPFAQVKKNTIAECLHKGTLHILWEDSILDIAHVKSKGNITMHGDTNNSVTMHSDVAF